MEIRKNQNSPDYSPKLRTNPFIDALTLAPLVAFAVVEVIVAIPSEAGRHRIWQSLQPRKTREKIIKD